MMTKDIKLSKLVTYLKRVILGLVVTFSLGMIATQSNMSNDLGLNDTVASAKVRVTPIMGSGQKFDWRQEDRTITYYMGSTSKYYRGVWNRSINRWKRDTKVLKFKQVYNRKLADLVLTSCELSPDGSWMKESGITYNHRNLRMDGTPIRTTATCYIVRSTVRNLHYKATERSIVGEHEIGHGLGLAHNPYVKSSIMWSGCRYPRYSRINANDRLAIRKLYNKMPLFVQPK